MTLLACLTFALTAMASMAATWLMRRTALRIGLTDRPDGHRKLHTRITPLGGGLAVFAATIGAIAVLAVLDHSWRTAILAHRADLLGLLLAGAVVTVLGAADDVFSLRGRQKLLGQIFAAALIPAFGLSVDRIQCFSWTLELGVFSAPFTVLWLVGAINAINLLDGIDGLAATLGIVLSGAVGLMALLTGHAHLAMIAGIFAASLAGFLWFNFPPASIFLGDAGSMLIGLTVGTLAIEASLKGPGTVLLAAPVAMWTIPIFDSGAAILRRKLTGRSIYVTDRGHLHHRLVQTIGNRSTLICLAGCSVFTSAAALMSVWWHNDLIAVVSAVAVVLTFIVTRVFGHSEALLVASRLRGFLRSTFSLSRSAQSEDWQAAVRLQGSREWELLWTTLTEWAAKLQLREIRLDVNVPLIGEGYNASWKRAFPREADRIWRLDLPLTADGRVIGYLRIAGDRTGAASENLQQVLDLLEPFESHLMILAEHKTSISGAGRFPSVPVPRIAVNGNLPPVTVG